MTWDRWRALVDRAAEEHDFEAPLAPTTAGRSTAPRAKARATRGRRSTPRRVTARSGSARSAPRPRPQHPLRSHWSPRASPPTTTSSGRSSSAWAHDWRRGRSRRPPQHDRARRAPSRRFGRLPSPATIVTPRAAERDGERRALPPRAGTGTAKPLAPERCRRAERAPADPAPTALRRPLRREYNHRLRHAEQCESGAAARPCARPRAARHADHGRDDSP